MASVASQPPYHSSELGFSSSLLHPHSSDPDRRRIIKSTWHILEQAPPPSLREILGAYKSRGDGDRDMLIAMLNAKSAEDQRLASIAALQRSLLEISTVDSRCHPPSSSFPPSPVIQLHHAQHHCQSSGSFTSDAYPHCSIPAVREPPRSSQPPPKRQRHSRSPGSSHRGSRNSSHDFPPSPYSSACSDSVEQSPRSRTSIPIGSLLSSDPSRDIKTEESRKTPSSSSSICRPSISNAPAVSI
ncbi:hypothetical protein SERLA73DRAFT_157749 [Serpula lacrymans var. lacrymans S7.3]|uniref:Uncharacterized protein n=2 Tax=Serpula lacrymans var. lacrymans TaxID=341189 RepID=F8PH25_SERL3|nr:uncharacterized protein SERLADRAFT_455010 [Serpula lacrymans var. lacrymans S7.9]EGO04921.1 hypothetical protein SERLA73DRAFT_157749 [Serpula lacrymans var. lacrymans S7.3]EGO30729.1 hypothetical protein SERLADRAFT_455010 [Serpula lacrymans var. lacrymans S7.9]